MIAADYPFLEVLWTMVVFFAWIAWFWLLFTVWTDIFRRADLSGLGKTVWLIFTLVLPFIGVFAYLIANNQGMITRHFEREKAQQAHFDRYVHDTAASGSAAAEIERAKLLLDTGAITQEEFDSMKRMALA